MAKTVVGTWVGRPTSEGSAYLTGPRHRVAREGRFFCFSLPFSSVPSASIRSGEAAAGQQQIQARLAGGVLGEGGGRFGVTRAALGVDQLEVGGGAGPVGLVGQLGGVLGGAGGGASGA